MPDLKHTTILEKAIKKAIDGGWKQTNQTAQAWKFMSPNPGAIYHTGYDFIFNHDFAKALWGEDTVVLYTDEGGQYTECPWEEHLKRMVIAEDPIQYLGENI